MFIIPRQVTELMIGGSEVDVTLSMIKDGQRIEDIHTF